MLQIRRNSENMLIVSKAMTVLCAGVGTVGCKFPMLCSRNVLIAVRDVLTLLLSAAVSAHG